MTAISPARAAAAQLVPYTPGALLGPLDDGRRTVRRPRRAVIVGTYPPTQCGIATYTENMRRALDGAGVPTSVIRLASDPEADRSVPEKVVWTWRRSDVTGPSRAARVADSFDVVIVQHEFGIYPGVDGSSVLDFVAECSRPVITVLHTVEARPTRGQVAIVTELVRRSSFVVVHTAVAHDHLLSAYDAEPSKVALIPHGAAPNLGPGDALEHARPMVLTWGLLGPGKGIELGIEAVALLRRGHLEVSYVVAGQTHPNVRARDGEAYRHQLGALARQLGVDDLVEFDDRYRNWNELRALVRSATVVLLPYRSTAQVTSGVLVEAMAAAKPVVATEFPHALELARKGAVVCVPHDDPAACARAIERILTDASCRVAMERAATEQARRHDWSVVADRMTQLVEAAVSIAADGLVAAP